jgi:C-terminal processing protease CtpA/Prc
MYSSLIAVEVKYVEGKTIVTKVLSPVAAEAGINIGDQVISVNKQDVEEKKRVLTSILSASTPQALQWKIHQKLLAGEKDSKVAIELINKVKILHSLCNTVFVVFMLPACCRNQ